MRAHQATARRTLGIFALAILAVLPLAPMLGSLRSSGRVIVTSSDTVTEDLYAFGGSVIIEGTVEGDLFTFTNDLIVSGTVTGDILGAVGGTASIDGTVGGSVRLAAVRLDITGTVSDDVAGVAFDALVAADVRRDILVIAGELVTGGRVGRDIRSQSWSLEVHGEVGRDVIARVDDIVVGAGARVGGDVEFQSSDRVVVDQAASVGGSIVERDVLAPVWAKATVRVIAWLSILAFLVGGLLGIWLFRSTMPRAVRAVTERPWRSAGVGLLTVVAIPLAVVPFGLSLVGLPIAVILLLVWIVALVLGATPAIAAAGTRLVGHRGGLAGGFVVGAFAWRAAMWVLSLVAALVYLAATVVGIGAFVLGAREARAAVGHEDWRPRPPVPGRPR